MFRLPVDADVVNEAKRNSELQVTDESRSPMDDLAWAVPGGSLVISWEGG